MLRKPVDESAEPETDKTDTPEGPTDTSSSYDGIIESKFIAASIAGAYQRGYICAVRAILFWVLAMMMLRIIFLSLTEKD